jgi:hypothetical protein
MLASPGVASVSVASLVVDASVMRTGIRLVILQGFWHHETSALDPTEWSVHFPPGPNVHAAPGSGFDRATPFGVCRLV